MAPIQKRSKPSSARAVPRKSHLLSEAMFTSSKKDKRTIKHSSFLQKIEKSSSATKKRRRPSKKLVATLESLADALPDVGESVGAGAVVGQARIRAKSFKTRPGAMKRKEKLEKGEKDEFSKNMAILMANPGDNSGAASDSAQPQTRWEALRAAIGSYEKKPEIKTD